MADTELPKDYVVVLLSHDKCSADPDAKCVMEAYGPYTREEAQVAKDTFPVGLNPHAVRLNPA